MFLRICVLLVIAYPLSSAFSQTTKPAQAADNDLVQKQFGSSCKMVPGPQPMTAALNGDRVEGVGIVARCTAPLMGEAERDYKLIDPYDAGLVSGDATVTA